MFSVEKIISIDCPGLHCITYIVLGSLDRVPTNLESQGESGKVREFWWSGKVREKSGNFGWSQGKRRKEKT